MTRRANLRAMLGRAKLGRAILASLLIAGTAAAASADRVGRGSRPPIDTAACDAAAAYSEARRGVSLLVLKDGLPICERYAPGVSPEDAFPIHSGTKSLVGMAAAAAVQDKLLRLDERVSDTLPGWRSDPQLRGITVRQILSLTSGLHPGAVGAAAGFDATVAAATVVAPAGSRFAYGPAPFQIFGAVLVRKLAAHGKAPDFAAYVDQHLAQPSGFRISDWRRADGDPNLGGGAVMTARDWARFGELVRRGGSVQGRMIVDRDAFRAQFRGSQSNPAYGLTWWLPKPAPDPDLRMPGGAFDIVENAAVLPSDLVMAAGAGEQRLYVIPSLGLTIVRQARIDRATVARRRAAAGAQEGPAPARAWSDTALIKILVAR